MTDLLRSPVMLMAFGFGSGLAPVAPGTFGSLVGLAIVVLLQPLSTELYLLCTLGACLIGIPVCGIAAGRLGVHDHGGIVWDEIAGMMIAGILLPKGLAWLLAAFALFRLFDIVKPWPIRWLDRHVAGGFGIMVDDLLAGLMAFLILQGIVFLPIA